MAHASSTSQHEADIHRLGRVQSPVPLPKPANSHMNARAEVEVVDFANSHIGVKEVGDCTADESEDCRAHVVTAQIGSGVAVARSWSWSTEQANKHMDLPVHSCYSNSTPDRQQNCTAEYMDSAAPHWHMLLGYRLTVTAVARSGVAWAEHSLADCTAEHTQVAVYS